MGERYVRPPLVPREARSHPRTVWPFRLLLAALGVLAVLALALLYSRLNDAAEQAPGVESGLRAPAAVTLDHPGSAAPSG